MLSLEGREIEEGTGFRTGEGGSVGTVVVVVTVVIVGSILSRLVRRL